MNNFVWIAQGLLAAAFLGAGLLKTVKGPVALREDPKMGWANDFSDGFIRFIGAAEIAGAVGLVAPALTGIIPVLTPTAASALTIIMLGAAYTHFRRKEIPFVFPALILGIMSGFVAYARFVLLPLS